MMRAERIRLIATVPEHEEAIASVQQPGDAALVVRGTTRALILSCPCGCRDILTINLDPRSGPAWRFYLHDHALTLFPSYWRNSHCESHFILWSNRIYWCDYELWTNNVSEAVCQRVLENLPAEFTKYGDLAEKLGDIPWEVLDACRALVKEGKAERHSEKRRRDEFRRVIF